MKGPLRRFHRRNKRKGNGKGLEVGRFSFDIALARVRRMKREGLGYRE